MAEWFAILKIGLELFSWPNNCDCNSEVERAEIPVGVGWLAAAEKTLQLPWFSLRTGREKGESVDCTSSESKIPVWESGLSLKNLAMAMPDGKRRREGVRGLFLFRSENSIERLWLVQRLIKDINLNF